MTKQDEAVRLFLEGYNCAQSVAGAYAKELGMEVKDAMRLVSSFGAGMGRMREVCGSFSGILFVAGALYGYDDPKDMEGKKRHYERVQYLAQQFKKHTGSIICRELLGKQGKDNSPIPSERTKEYYKKRPCAAMVELAVTVLEEYRLEN